jgi:hypothetical protein
MSILVLMKTTIRLGDTVKGIYHGTPFEGVLRSFDGSGYLYIVPTSPLTVYGVPRESIAIHPQSEERDSLRFVSSPEEAPTVKVASFASGGGAYVPGLLPA